MADSLHVTHPKNATKRKLSVAVQCPEEPQREQFIFRGKDLFAQLREDVKVAKEAFQDLFKTPIPILDIDGKLVKDPKDKKAEEAKKGKK